MTKPNAVKAQIKTLLLHIAGGFIFLWSLSLPNRSLSLSKGGPCLPAEACADSARRSEGGSLTKGRAEGPLLQRVAEALSRRDLRKLEV